MAEESYANPTGPVTIGSFIHKKPGMTEEDFYRYWYTRHGALVAPWAEKYGLIGYRQFHTPSAIRKKWTDLTGVPCVDCDGFAEATFSSIEGYLSASQDSYWQEVVNPDHDNFWDSTANTTISPGLCSMAGTVRWVIKDGKVMPDFKKGAQDNVKM
ncbi:hypothetical protein AYO21_10598 [Fonsecaea monophora]|uniref:EthD domain-containing protein n=1 Tax=Fonsecaea monophora TaxID=254056 RepID=A0A177EV83_9EURO|nr:hypothetical protein AYO21_10598 [Fonsecaea monophora]KAH0829691.1 Dimeric alpha+beta barrel [Fonsecaea pedrosoi]OAG35200.1 hypothetical protein AYO21_10598 [Fonsecaea monophora]